MVRLSLEEAVVSFTTPRVTADAELVLCSLDNGGFSGNKGPKPKAELISISFQGH